MSATQRRFTPTFALDDTFVVEGSGRAGAEVPTILQYKLREGDYSALHELVADLDIIYSVHPPDDSRAGWHHNTHGYTVWLRAHIFRLAKGWGTQQAADWFAENTPETRCFGFAANGRGLERFAGDPPSQSRLWEVYNEEFTDQYREFCQTVAEDIVEYARDNGIPAPDDVFEPDDDRDGESERSEKRLTNEKMKEVWAQAKPFVMDSFELDRAQNTRIPEGSFWEAHAYAGTLQDAFTEGGLDAYRMNTTRPEDQQQVGRTHRHHLQNLDVPKIRSMMQETTRTLVARARHNGELQGKLWAAIDITKGAPWTGDIDWTDDSHPEDDYILGYKDKETESIDYYFQWATLQVVGLDVPLVLDAIPVRRGMTKDEIVDELLNGALDIVPDLDLVMMDREFDATDVRAVCEKHGVYYLTPGRKHSSERATCTRLREAGKRVHVEEKSTLTGPARKRVYLPARNTDVFEETSDEDAADEEDGDDREEFRQELVADFMDTTDTDLDDEDGGEWFDDVVDDVRGEEGELAGNDSDVAAYAFFKTNHPALDVEDDASEDAVLSTVRGFISRYANRWGIENGYKMLKQFRVRTSSKDHGYRYFCFTFACLLYNIWRLVDLLVKLAFEDEPAYSPRVRASTFLTLAGQHIGLDPPD